MLPSDRQILPNEGRPQVIHPFGVSLLQDVDDLKAPFRQRNHDVLPDGAQQPQQHAFLTTRSSLPAPGSSCNYSLERITAGVNFAVLAGVLGVLNMYVVAGNMLIILAVLLFAKLRRSRTNTFIVSLAFSDFMLGLLVLPFSTTNMMLEKHWIFGDIWCSGWLGIDVLLCTASIWNLMAISLERYLAIRRPLSYQRLLTPLRCKLLIFAVWIVSFLICLPAFFKKQSDDSADVANLTAAPLRYYNSSNFTHLVVAAISLQSECSKKIECTIEGSETLGEKLYTIYSACGSFFIPATVIIVFYAQIYRTAARSIKAMRTGRLITNGGGGAGGEMCLRVHYGTARTTSAISTGVISRKITPSPRSPLRRYPNSASTYAIDVSDPLSPLPRARTDSNASNARGGCVARSESAGSKAEMLASATAPDAPRPKIDSNSSRTPSAEKAEDASANREEAVVQCAARKPPPLRNRFVQQSQSCCANESQPLDSQASVSEGQSHPDSTLINAHCQMHSPFPPISEDPAGESQSLLSATADHVFLDNSNDINSNNGGNNKHNDSKNGGVNSALHTGPQRPNQNSAPRCARVVRELSGRSVSSQHAHGGMSRSLSETSSENAGAGSTSAPAVPPSSAAKRLTPAISQSTNNLHHVNALRSPGGGRNSLVVEGSNHIALFTRAQLPAHQPTLRNPTGAARHSETRALKTVAVICGTFVCCWMPFFVSYLIQPFCNCVPDITWDVCFWLGYFNSACNPLIYASFSRDFRSAFLHILTLRLHSRPKAGATRATLGFVAGGGGGGDPGSNEGPRQRNSRD